MTLSVSIGSATLRFPTFMPVTTFGGKFPLDEIVRPYLSRLFPATMVSYHYAQQMRKKPKGVLFIDSGGFASLFEGSEAIDRGEFVDIKTKEGDLISPPDVLAFQERWADIGATVDFIVPPNCPLDEAKRRQGNSITNAIWAIGRKRKSAFLLYASIQAWDRQSAKDSIEMLAGYPFDGFALGGMVPRIQRPDEIIAIVDGIREVEKERPLHVFGIGSPKLATRLFAAGVDSTDSSSYVRAAADGKYLLTNELEYALLTEDLVTQCSCDVCRKHTAAYLGLESETNRMALALHNLSALNQCLNRRT